MKTDHAGVAVFTIRVRGCIGERWEQWLDGMLIAPAALSGETVLTGQVLDQAALLGLLQKLHNLGLLLLEVRMEQGDGAPPEAVTRSEEGSVPE